MVPTAAQRREKIQQENCCHHKTMKKSLIRVALSFATFNDGQLNSAAVVLIFCLKNNALFPGLPITIAAFTALQLAFQNAMAASAIGGVMDTATKNEARDALVVA